MKNWKKLSQLKLLNEETKNVQAFCLFFMLSFSSFMFFCVNDLETIHGVNEQLKKRCNKVHKFTTFCAARLFVECYTIRRFTTNCYLVYLQKGFYPWPAANSHSFCGVKSRRRSADSWVTGQQFTSSTAKNWLRLWYINNRRSTPSSPPWWSPARPWVLEEKSYLERRVEEVLGK